MSATVLIRAKLTAAEWRDIRKIALDLDQPVSDVVAQALREHLLGKEGKPE